MAALLGKRKRRVDVAVSLESTEERGPNDTRLQQLLKQHFEATYAPLEGNAAEPSVDSYPTANDSVDEDSPDWEGFSSDNNSDHVEVVQHAPLEVPDVWRDWFGRRSFMSSKPPSSKNVSSMLSSSAAGLNNEAEAQEAALIKNDLALQRLLSETTLLHAARNNAHGTMPSAVHPNDDPAARSALALRGTDRHRAWDLRLQQLGARSSLFKQTKMPLDHRLGIVAKRRTREAERRREARENGIVLERAPKERTGAQKRIKGQRRERGVGGPRVGKMRGGTLVLSRRDVKNISGDNGERRNKGLKKT